MKNPIGRPKDHGFGPIKKETLWKPSPKSPLECYPESPAVEIPSFVFEQGLTEFFAPMCMGLPKAQYVPPTPGSPPRECPNQRVPRKFPQCFPTPLLFSTLLGPSQALAPTGQFLGGEIKEDFPQTVATVAKARRTGCPRTLLCKGKSFRPDVKSPSSNPSLTMG